jgi:hypothetical protein
MRPSTDICSCAGRPQGQGESPGRLLEESRLSLMADGKFEEIAAKDGEIHFRNERARFRREAMPAELIAHQLVSALGNPVFSALRYTTKDPQPSMRSLKPNRIHTEYT